MPLIKSASKKAVGENIKREMAAGKPQKQSIAIALEVKRRSKKKKMADGGSVDQKPQPSPSPSPSSDDEEAMPIGKRIHYPRFAKGGQIDIDDKIDADSRDEDELHMLHGKGGRDGAELRAGSMKPDADSEKHERSLDMGKQKLGYASHELEDGPEINFHDEDMAESTIDDAKHKRSMDMAERPKPRFAKGGRVEMEHIMPEHRHMYAEGGELDARDESMDANSIDDAKSARDENMLDAHPRRHLDEKRAGSRGLSPEGEDERDDVELGMLSAKAQPDEYSKEGRINYAKGGMVEQLMRKRRMAEGGDVDLQDNADEDLNEEDQLSYGAARKKTYYDDDQLSRQPTDSNRHGRDLPDEDEHDMVNVIRKKMRSRYDRRD